MLRPDTARAIYVTTVVVEACKVIVEGVPIRETPLRVVIRLEARTIQVCEHHCERSM